MKTDLILPPTGHFILDVFHKGVLVPELCMDEANLVVIGRKVTLARLLGGDTTNRPITQIGMGTSATAAADGNTALTGVFKKAMDSVSYPATDQVQFNFSLASGENNGMGINEFGLLTGADVLFARKVRSSVLNKTSDISFSGSWVITFN